jgi:hypothetical protein
MNSWDVYYQGYRIEVVEIRGRILIRGGISRIKELKVNGVIVTNAKIVQSDYNWNWNWATIHAKYYFSNIEKEIEVRLAYKPGFAQGRGFQVFIDGEYIGNDKCINYPSLEETIEKIGKGFWRSYFINLLQILASLYSTLAVVILINIPISKISTKENFSQFPLSYLLINLILFIAVFNVSSSSWNRTKLIAKKLLIFEEKWKSLSKHEDRFY